MTLTIIDRKDWGARAPRRPPTPIPTPTRELWLHHSADDRRGAAAVRAHQDFQMDVRGWSDIAYSYLIDPGDLVVYEGRGPGILGGHTFGRNSISHAICVLGNFQKTRPTPALLDKIAELVAYGHRQGWWPDQLTGGHRDVRDTDCPGIHLYSQIPAINAIVRQLLNPTTGDAMQAELIERLEQSVAELGYSIEVDQDLELRTVVAVENMVTGVRRLLNERNTLRDHLEAATALIATIRTEWDDTIRPLDDHLTAAATVLAEADNE